MEHWDAIAAGRRALADQLEGLTPDQWATQSLCGAWSVRDVVAHLVVPHRVTMFRFVLALVRAGGSFARANVAVTAPRARRGFVDAALPAVRWVATDLDWVHGDGPEVRGPAAALALSMSGRDARTGELDGPGVALVMSFLP